MPVYSRRRTNPTTEYYARYERTGEVSYVGRVLQVYTDSIQTMSDVWDSGTFALVWDDEKQAPATIYMSCTEFGGDKEAEADATDEVRALYDAYQAEKARLAAEADYRRRCEDARLRLLAPVVGATARVVKGRKVPVGTEGVVTWKGIGGYGERVGIKDAAGNVHYTAIDNVVRTGVDLLDGEDWLTAEDRLMVRLPCKGERVEVTAGESAGAVGTVFYVQGLRLGVATSDRKVDGRYADVVWTDAGSVRLVRWDYKAPEVAPVPVAGPATPAVAVEIPF